MSDFTKDLFWIFSIGVMMWEIGLEYRSKQETRNLLAFIAFVIVGIFAYYWEQKMGELPIWFIIGGGYIIGLVFLFAGYVSKEGEWYKRLQGEYTSLKMSYDWERSKSLEYFKELDVLRRKYEIKKAKQKKKAKKIGK